jgi:hypothetical protein
MQRIASCLLVTFSLVVALGSSPFRLDAASAFSEQRANIAVSGVVDLNRRLALRLCLLSVRFELGPYDNTEVCLGAPEVLGVSAFDAANVLYSPFRDRWRVEPYVHGGLGFGYSLVARGDSALEQTALEFRLGLGVERLLFFLKKAPSVFIENTMVIGGTHARIPRPQGSGANQLFPELKLEQELRIGVRI